MSYTSDLAAGIRSLLLPIAPIVVIGPLQTTQQDAVGITPYPVDDNDETGEITSAVQIRIRGTATGGVKPVLDRQDAIWQAICMPSPLSFPTLTVVMAWRQMSAPLGLDAQGRPEIADTYYLRSDRLGRSG